MRLPPLLFWSALLGFGLPLVGADQRPNVLVVHSYHIGMPWVDAVNRGLHETLDGQAELVITQLDIKRFPAPGREEAMAVTVSSKRAASNARLIITVDDYAYQLCLKQRDKLFPGVPIVFGGVNYWSGQQPTGVTGVQETLDLTSTLRLMRQLHPDADRLVVVNDTTETGRANRAALEQSLAEVGNWQVVYLGDGSFAETEAALAALRPARDVVLLLSWNRDSTGAARSYDDAVARVHAVCPSPIYGVWGFYFGHGIVGGALLDGVTHGREIGSVAAQVLAGTPPENIPIGGHCRTWLAVDERELIRLGIPAERVPKGVEVVFRHYSLWREYRVLILSVSLVVLVQSLTIVSLVLARRRRIRAEVQLRKSEQNLSVTLASMADAMVSTDTQGRIVTLNPVAETLTGWQASEALGRMFREVFFFVPEQAGTPVPAFWEEALSKQQAVRIDTPQRLRHRAGQERMVTASAAPIRDAGESLIGVVAVLHDISEHRRLEDQLRQSQKIEAIGLLAGGVAHDFNNLLQVIRSSLQLANDPQSTEAEANELRRQANEAVDRAAELTRQLLAFGRRQKLEVRQVSLRDLVENLVKMIRRLIGETIQVAWYAPTDPHWIMGDNNQIDQVILNLCINARDAMPKGGRLALELSECVFTDADVRNQPWMRAGRFAVLSVSDSGCGMDRATLDRIFEPFFTTKAQGHGTGLGLAVVQGVIQQHNGLINVYSEPGHGTTFRVYLPAAAAPESAPAPTSATAVPQRLSRPRTVLFAEDDPGVRLTTAALLQRAGYTVISVADGQEAVAMVERNPGIEIAMLDVVMPKLNGWDAARQIQQSCPRLPILLCSGYAAQIIDTAPLPSHWRYLTKPYPGDTLLHLLQEMLADAPAAAPASGSIPSTAT